MGRQRPRSTDVLTPEQRSYCMSRIQGKDTKPEIALRKALWNIGLRYRIHYRLPGRPDIVFPRFKLVVFVDGCFWHGCPVHAVKPMANAVFWRKKLEGNRVRDKVITARLKKEGWVVLRYWEHEVEDRLDGVVKRIVKAIDKSIDTQI